MTGSDYPYKHPTKPSGRGAAIPKLLAARAIGIGDPANHQHGNTPGLVGREKEQARLRRLLDDAIVGSGSLVLIGGEAGVGKTALATSIGLEAHSRGVPVWVGHCYELAAMPPYGPWMDSRIFELSSEDVPPPPLLDVGEGSAAASSQIALFERMQKFLAAVVRHDPLVLILEDLHWSDPASLELLRFVSRDLNGLRILLVATYRDDEVTRQCPLYGFLPTLVREARASRIDLRRLDEPATRALVAARYELPKTDKERLVTYLMDLAEGNPFFAMELLRTLEEEGFLSRDADGWSLGALGKVPVPPLLRQVIDGRLRRLGEEGRELLAVAAVIGQQVSWELWRLVSGVSDERLIELVERAIEAHLMEETPDGQMLRFVHALIREELYREVVLPRRREWHRRAAEVLASTSRPDPDEVAHHFRQAGDSRAAEWLIRAGTRAERTHAWLTAAERFETALHFLGEDEEHNRGWLLFRIGVLLRYSDTPRSISYLEEAGRVAKTVEDRVLAVNSWFVHGLVRCMTGREMRRGLAEMEASIAASEGIAQEELAQSAGVSARPVANASAISEQMLFGITGLPEALRGLNPGTNTLVEWLAHLGRYEQAVEIGEGYVARVAAAQPEETLKLALCNNAYFGLGVACAGLGRPVEARRWFELAHRAYREFDHYLMDSLALVNELLLVVLPYYPELLAERRRLADEEISLQKRGAGALSGAVSWLGIGAHWLSILEGEWYEARRLMQPRRGPSEEGVLRQYAFRTLGELARDQGRPDEAWEYVNNVLPLGLVTEPGDNRFFSALATQRLAANLALDAGDYTTARAWIEAHDRWLEWSGAVLRRAEGSLLWARYYHETGDTDLAHKHATDTLAFATEPRQPLMLLAIHRFFGELDRGSGRLAEAREHIEEALSLADACAAPYERALTLLVKTTVLVATGEAEKARAALEEARGICIPLGAEPALRKAAALEEWLADSPTSAANPSVLTAREVEVLRLVAEGLTDGQVARRLHVSPRTVGNHLRSIYKKLDVPTRTAAARRAVERGLL